MIWSNQADGWATNFDEGAQTTFNIKLFDLISLPPPVSKKLVN